METNNKNQIPQDQYNIGSRSSHEHNVKNQFDNDYQSQGELHSKNEHRRFYHTNRIQDQDEYDREHDYYDKLRNDQSKLDNIRQGLGVSDFKGKHAHYSTQNERQRERKS